MDGNCNLPIVCIIKLIGPHRVFQGFGMRLGLESIMRRVCNRDGRDGINSSTKSAQQIDLLLGLRFWHIYYELESHSVAHVR